MPTRFPLSSSLTLLAVALVCGPLLEPARPAPATSYDGRVRIFGVELASPDLKLRKELRHAGTANVYVAEFLRDGARLVTTSGDQTIAVWGQ